jgi:hypothetical protein
VPVIAVVLSASAVIVAGNRVQVALLAHDAGVA